MLLRLARLALIYNTVILVGVALNQEWVRTRAAGGGFEQFPGPLRVTYALQAGLMLFLIWFIARASRLWALILAAVFAVSTLMQLISRSPDERWNAIPAIIIAIAFFMRARSEREVSSGQALR